VRVGDRILDLLQTDLRKEGESDETQRKREKVEEGEGLTVLEEYFGRLKLKKQVCAMGR
jgi:hypothetical protein